MNWKDTQLIYHALARKNEECLVLTGTREPYACIGFAQDMKKELDLDYCKENGIGYFRRETGGGTVYLDENQLFYQVIIKRDNPLTPRLTEPFFRRFLKPVVRTLEKFRMKGRFVPINDIIVDDRTIATLHIVVDTETVGQFTGLQDKKGKDIYEGDYIFSECEGGNPKLPIVFENGAFWLDE